MENQDLIYWLNFALPEIRATSIQSQMNIIYKTIGFIRLAFDKNCNIFIYLDTRKVNPNSN